LADVVLEDSAAAVRDARKKVGGDWSEWMIAAAGPAVMEVGSFRDYSHCSADA
jgi:hypothetical protein